MWLLPRYFGGEMVPTDYRFDPPNMLGNDEVSVVVEQAPIKHTHNYRFPWWAPFSFAQISVPRLRAFPPVLEPTVKELCPLYVPVKSRWQINRYFKVVEELRQTDRTSIRRVAGERGDLSRWFDATNAYLSELSKAECEVYDHWHKHGRKIPLNGLLKRRSFRRWQAVVENAHERVVAASDQYRPVFDQVTDLIAEADSAYDALAEQYRVLNDWEERRIWHLERFGDVFLITRTGVARDGKSSGKPIRDVYKAAHDKRYHDLRAIDWDENAIAACDAELNQLFGKHRDIGRTLSGEPLVQCPALSFTDWFDRHVGYDFRSISDRDELAKDLRRRARVKADMERRRAKSEGGGSWPTDYTDSDGGDSGGFGGFSI